MTWKCPTCGFEENTDDSRHCIGGCGYARIPRTVVLTANATGKQIRMSVDTTVGKYLLRSFAGEESVYASEPQFKFYKDDAMGSWLVQHLDGAKNPTYCDGEDISTAPAAIQEGSVVSIGAEYLKLVVHFDE